LLEQQRQSKHSFNIEEEILQVKDENEGVDPLKSYSDPECDIKLHHGLRKEVTVEE